MLLFWHCHIFAAHVEAIRKAEDEKKRKEFKQLKEQMQEDLQVWTIKQKKEETLLCAEIAMGMPILAVMQFCLFNKATRKHYRNLLVSVWCVDAVYSWSETQTRNSHGESDFVAVATNCSNWSSLQQTEKVSKMFARAFSPYFAVWRCVRPS